MKARAVLALLALLSTSSLSAAAEEVSEGHYLDPSGRRVAFEPVYESWFGADRYERNWGRMLGENAGLLVFELGVYWFDPELNFVDWQFPDLGSKLTSREAFRFDDNLLHTNYLFHSFAGASHYVFTRTNGFGVIGSFTAAAASSALYEMLLEWKELVSFNDLVVTPIGGTAMGEFFYHLGNYLNSEQPRPRLEVHPPPGAFARGSAKTVLGIPRVVHDAIDEPAQPLRVEPDELGLSSAYAHRFRVALTQDSLQNDAGKMGGLFGLDGEFELAAMPGFLRPGRFERWFDQGNFTSFDLRLAFGSGGRDSELCFDSHLFGSYAQDLRATPEGTTGYANEAALGPGLCYRNRKLLGRVDQYGVVHLPRPVERLWLRLGPAELRLEADASLDFASLYSAAFERYARRFGREGVKSSLRRHGYFHGWGFSAGAGAALRASGFEVAARARWGRYESIDGVERMQEDVTFEPHHSETVANVAGHVGFEPEGSKLATRLELVHDVRGGKMGSFEAWREDRRLSVALGVRF